MPEAVTTGDMVGFIEYDLYSGNNPSLTSAIIHFINI
jgi:hypothetical protein